MKQTTIVGKRVPYLDAYNKVTGGAQYLADLHFDHLLYGKILRSPYGHAKILKIDKSKALALPGVHCVISAEDVPDTQFTLCGHPLPYDTPLDCQIFNNPVRYVGDPVAAVAAETPEIAQKALTLIEVEYEQLPVYTTPEESLADDATELHSGSKNLCGEIEVEIGDVNAAFAAAPHVVETVYDAPIVTHCQMESHQSVVTVNRGTGRLTVYTPTQVPMIMKERLAFIFGLKRHKVHIVQTCVGGGFGGKQEPVYEHINCALTLACTRPVMLELTTEETLTTTRTRHSAKFTIKSALDKQGKILARELTVYQNTGAYSSHGHNVIMNQFGRFDELYPAPNLKFTGKTVYTNILIAAAMRAYGIPQYCSAMEAHIDRLAQEMNMDPVQFRQLNLIRDDYTCQFNNNKRYDFSVPALLESGMERIGYGDYSANQPAGDGIIKRGIGVALGSYAACVYGHSCELSGARISVADDGSASLFLGTTEIGQGTHTGLAQVAAETLGIPFEWVTVVDGDTDTCPNDSGAYASRQTFVAANAVVGAARACKKQILEYAVLLSEEAGTPKQYEDLDILNGNVILSETEEVVYPLQTVMEDLTYHFHRGTTCCHEVGYTPTENVNTYACTFAQVAVNTETGKVDVEKIVTTIDCGTILNPMGAEGQLYGGTIMSFGYGTMEQLLIDPKTGATRNGNLLDYKIPTFADLPDIDGKFLEYPSPASVYGNKSLGEPPNITAAAAIHNGVTQALGFAVNANPLTPERVYLAIANHEKGGD